MVFSVAYMGCNLNIQSFKIQNSKFPFYQYQVLNKENTISQFKVIKIFKKNYLI